MNKEFSKKFNNKLKELQFKTETEGIHHIFRDSSLLIEEQNYGRLLLLNSNGDLEWEYINRGKNGKVYILNWSSIIDDYKLIKYIKKKIENKKCPM